MSRDVEAVIEGAASSLRRPLLLHCYRMLGGVADAEDAVQESLLLAWAGRSSLRDPGKVRAWLFAIATRVCLTRRRRRALPHHVTAPAVASTPPQPRYLDDVWWVEPLPDTYWGGRGETPEDVSSRREDTSLAFIAVLQQLSPRERAAVLLMDVLDWTAGEIATALSVTPAAVNSALQRARAKLSARSGDPGGPVDGDLLRRFMRAWEDRDAVALSELLCADVRVTMPPDALWFDSRRVFLAFLGATLFSPGAAADLRVVPVGANGQSAMTMALRDGDRWVPLAVMVLAQRGRRVAEITGFTAPDTLARFPWGDPGSEGGPLPAR